MIVTNDQELEGLKKIGRIVALAREEMKRKAEIRHEHKRP